MKSKKPNTDFWFKMLDRRQLLKTLGVAGSVMAFSGPRGLAEAMGQVSSVEAAERAGGRADGTGGSGEPRRLSLGPSQGSRLNQAPPGPV